MPISISRRHALLALGSSGLLLNQPVWANTPARSTTQLVVGFPPGGGIDLLGRVTAEVLRNTAKENVIVENRAGVAGRLALEYVKNTAPADGSTLLLTPDFPLTIFPHLYKKLPYDPIKDFLPVAGCAKSDLVMSIGPAVPDSVKTLAQFLEWAKAHAGQVSFASSGPGGILHLLGVSFNQATGIDMTHVPFKGSAPALQALVGGQIAVSSNAVGEAIPFLSTARLRTLVVFGATRSRFMPHVPTMAESGYSQVVADTWLGVFASAKVAPEQIQRWSSKLAPVIASEKFQEAVNKLSMEPYQASPETLAAKIKTDITRWAPVVAASGFKAEE